MLSDIQHTPGLNGYNNSVQGSFIYNTRNGNTSSSMLHQFAPSISRCDDSIPYRGSNHRISSRYDNDLISTNKNYINNDDTPSLFSDATAATRLTSGVHSSAMLSNYTSQTYSSFLSPSSQFLKNKLHNNINNTNTSSVTNHTTSIIDHTHPTQLLSSRAIENDKKILHKNTNDQNRIVSSKDSSNRALDVFIQFMRHIYTTIRPQRIYNNYVHPQQQQLVLLFDRQLRPQVELEIEESIQYIPFRDTGASWMLQKIEGEGIGEWSPNIYHFFTIFVRLLPIFPLLVTQASGFLAYNRRYHHFSAYTTWSKLIYYLFNQRMGKQDFFIDFSTILSLQKTSQIVLLPPKYTSSSSSSSSSLHRSHRLIKHDDIHRICRSHILYLSQLLFIIGDTFHKSLCQREEKYPTINYAHIYENSINNSSWEDHNDDIYSVHIDRGSVITYGAYIHSIRGLYAILKYVMIH